MEHTLTVIIALRPIGKNNLQRTCIWLVGVLKARNFD
jgi:hypothetical protein